MLNRVVLIGRLTRDPELRYTANGVAVVSFTLAVDRGFKTAGGERETDFIPVVAWRGLAENCANYLSQGKLAAVDGKLQIRSYEAKDGTRRTVAEVIADDVRFLSPKGEGGAAPARSNAAANSFYDDPGSGDIPLNDEEVPF